MLKKIKIFRVMFLTLFTIPFSLYSEATFQKLQINPLNRLTIFFDELPSDFNSFLNADKTVISVLIYGAKSTVGKDSILSDGIIKKAEMKKFSNHLEFNIYLKSPRGYTITPLEFSRALMIEVFDWNSLSPAEDNYRMGQLSITNNLAVARKYFEKAFDENIANAGFFLGYLHLKANLPEKALQILQKAERLGCNLPDVHSALAQTYFLLNDKENFEKYKSKFLNERDFPFFKFIEVEPQLKDSIFKEVSDVPVETELSQNIDTTKQTLDTIKATKPTVIKEKIVENRNEKFSIVEKLFIFLIASIVVTSILLLSLYVKWKKGKRLLEIKQKFEDELIRQKRKAIPNKIVADIYKRAEQTTKSETATEQQKPKISNLNPEIKTLAEQIIDSKKAEKDQQTSAAEKSNEKSNRYPPKVELALQIQKEQSELIKKKIDKLESTEIPLDKEKLEELAKNLGLNKTSLLARKNIEAIEKNKDIYKDLIRKFFPKKND
ncbi:MAG: tetratricopeptide repeat protein [Candidatus Kapaibacteriota bacterium]